MRLWIKLILGLLVLALLVWFMLRVGGMTLNFIRNANDGGEPDPMFAEEPEYLTMPPELSAETGETFEDNSANWDNSVQTPVDKTAAELEEEARNQSNGG